MFHIEKLHHVGIPVRDFAKMQSFYVRVLRLVSHPDKPNWLRAGDGFSVHLMPAQTPIGPPMRVEQHLALRVDSLHNLVSHLLRENLKPLQFSLDGQMHEITDPDDPLDFGIGTVFILDPENNAIEFLEKKKGLFAILPD